MTRGIMRTAQRSLSQAGTPLDRKPTAETRTVRFGTTSTGFDVPPLRCPFAYETRLHSTESLCIRMTSSYGWSHFRTSSKRYYPLNDSLWELPYISCHTDGRYGPTMVILDSSLRDYPPCTECPPFWFARIRIPARHPRWTELPGLSITPHCMKTCMARVTLSISAFASAAQPGYQRVTAT